MKIIVQKFGGTSLKEETGRREAVRHIKKAVDDGYKVVCVVSAMGRSGDPYATDTLLSLLDENNNITNREQDLLLSCGEIISSVVFSGLLNSSGIRAAALTGPQAGFRTNDDFSNARIIDMKCERLRAELENQSVVVVAGFQGQSKSGDIATLGRGGSDTSAAALGAALQAEFIDIFTDVEGVMTADPRLVKDARPLSVVTYAEICNMAYQGAKVIHPRAVEIAMQAKIPLRIRSTYSDLPGTLVTSSLKGPAGKDVQESIITGIAHVSNITQIKVYANDGQYDLQTKVFKAMAQEQISVDFINISPKGVVYTIMEDKTDQALRKLKEIGYEPDVTRNCAKVSAVGAGIAGTPGVTAAIVESLSSRNIQILQSADSHTTIWVLVKKEDLIESVNALHTTFRLNEEGITTNLQEIVQQQFNEY
ncbi:aspartate kinase [Fictibacillus phosphorivorans]|uniref:aspartate kinase n=1 Tax=Fictibacillus phosphorivorans TaxID=1221500 RepID=UPI002040FF7E|nr:aspartate kinase [Fictibacillus phosphorivorans]MCM3717106.1 aspartate kinase [Fictibacillus phosphorivorans]MCM3774793.1 aspartate kinase [Fictibacillus phosphorivorans]